MVSLAWAGCHGTGRGVCRWFTAAMDVIKKPCHCRILQWSRDRHRGCRVCTCKSRAEPRTAARRGAEWLGCHPSPVSGRGESGPDGVPRDGPGCGPQGHCRRELITELEEKPCRGRIWQWSRGRRHGHRVGGCKSRLGPAFAPRGEPGLDEVARIFTAGQARAGHRGVTVVEMRSRPAPGRATEGTAEVVKNERGQGKQCRGRVRQ